MSRLTTAALAIVVSLSLPAGLVFAATPGSFKAANWAGYEVQTSGNPQNDAVTLVTGSWTVPTASASLQGAGNMSICAVWVGIDGYNDKTVEQIGTNSTVAADGYVGYSAWYEMSPANAIPIPIAQLAINAGDSISATVQFDAPSSPGQFSMTIADNTTGGYYSAPYQPDSASIYRSSAEWIVEAPENYASAQVPLPTFGSVTFTGAAATVASTTGAIDDPSLQATRIDMTYPTFGDAMTTSALTDLGLGSSTTSSFIVTQAPEPASLAILAAAAALLLARPPRSTRPLAR